MKKKVSFDIEEEILSDLKEFCKTRKIKFSDFFREAVEEKLKKKTNNLFIFSIQGNQLVKFSIMPETYNISWSADVMEDLKEFWKREGIITKHKRGNNEEVNQILESEGFLKFWAK